MNAAPSTTDLNGDRDGRGRFAPGNKSAIGNPHAAKVARLRAALLDAVDENAVAQVVAALIRQAQGGNVQAVKELLDRTLGKPTEADLLERIERLEGIFHERTKP